MTDPTPLPALLGDSTLPALPFDAEGLTAGVDPATALATLPRLGRMTRTVRWLHGDLILALIDGDVAGRLHEAFQQIADLDIDDRPSLMRSLRVAHAIPHHRRRPVLSWSHHQAVAGFEDPADQDRWLDEAEQRGLTVVALEAAITEALRPHVDDDEELFPKAKPWHQRHSAVLAGIDEAFATDPGCAVVLRSDGTWRVLTEPT